MGSGASTNKYQSNDIQPLGPNPSTDPVIKDCDAQLRYTPIDKLSISVDSMQVNTSREDILEAVNRARNESALSSADRRLVNDLLEPTPPDSPAPTSRKHRSGSVNERAVAVGGHSSPQADFIIDEDSGQFDDESPAFNIDDINEFLSLQRQQTVSFMKNAQLEKEVAELEKQLRQMDMMDSTSSGIGGASTLPERLPSVDKPTIISGARAILSRERPNSGAAVMPDPTATTAHKDDSYTPSGTSSRQSSRGLVKSVMRNANSASALEAASPEHVRQYNNRPGSGKGPKQELSPPPSPPPPDPEDSNGLCKTNFVEYSGSVTHGSRQTRKTDKGENDHHRDNVLSDSTTDNDKPVMRFEQRPHNNHHRRHIGHRRNSSENNVRTDGSLSRDVGHAEIAADSLPAPRGTDAAVGQGSLALLSKKHKDTKERDKSTILVTRRRRTVDEKGHLSDEKPLLPNAEMKRLLVPVNTSAAPPLQGGVGNARGRGNLSRYQHPPKSTASLSPLQIGDDNVSATDNDDDSPKRLGDKASAQILTPLPVVPALKNGEDLGGRVPLLPVTLVKDKGRNNSVLQGVNRRLTRQGAEEDVLSTSAAAAYMEVISPRDDNHTDSGVDKRTSITSDAVMLSGKLSTRINNQAGNSGALCASEDALPSEAAAPPLRESISVKTSSVQQAARRRRDRASADGPIASTKVEPTSRDNDVGTDGETPTEALEEKKRVVLAKRLKRKSFGGNVLDDGDDSTAVGSSQTGGHGTDDGNSRSICAVDGAQLRPWSQTMDMRLGEVEFMLRKPISSDEDIMQVFNAAKDGLLFMDELNSVAKSLNMLRGALSRWLLPYDDKTRIDEQCSSFRTVVDNMPDDLVGKLTQKQVTYLVTEVNKVRQLVRVKIADDNDLEQARTALESIAMFFQRLIDEAAAVKMSPYVLFSSRRG